MSQPKSFSKAVRAIFPILLTASLVLLCNAAPAHADSIVYNGGSPDQNNAYFADTSDPYTMDGMSFVLSSGSSTVGDAHWWGTCGFGGSCPTGNFTLGFYTNNSGQPGTLLDSFSVGNANQTLTGNTIAGFLAEYSYSATFSSVPLTAGTTYWFTVGNSTSDAGWAMETTSETGSHEQYLTGTGWTSQPQNLAFNLTGPTSAPEPSTWLLLATGLLGLLVVASHRKATRCDAF